MQLNGTHGLTGWRWIFILEGVVCHLSLAKEKGNYHLPPLCMETACLIQRL